jgi:hypothetical protein
MIDSTSKRVLMAEKFRVHPGTPTSGSAKSLELLVGADGIEPPIFAL